MDQEEVIRTIELINTYLRGQPWFDFEVMSYAGYKLTLMGSLDPSGPHTVEIWFNHVSFVSLPMEWSTDTSQPALTLVTGEEARAINLEFRVESGNHLFQFAPEWYPTGFGCLIGAREVGFTQLPAKGHET